MIILLVLLLGALVVLVFAISSWVVCGHAWKAVVWEVPGTPQPTEGGVLSSYEQETHNILYIAAI